MSVTVTVIYFTSSVVSCFTFDLSVTLFPMHDECIHHMSSFPRHGCDWRLGRCAGVVRNVYLVWTVASLDCQSKHAVSHIRNLIGCCTSRKTVKGLMYVFDRKGQRVNGDDTSLNGSWLCWCTSSARGLLRLLLKQ